MVDEVVRPDEQAAGLQQRTNLCDRSFKAGVVDDVEQDVERGHDVEPAVGERPKVRSDIDLEDLGTGVGAAQRPGSDLGEVRTRY